MVMKLKRRLYCEVRAAPVACLRMVWDFRHSFTRHRLHTNGIGPARTHLRTCQHAGDPYPLRRRCLTQRSQPESGASVEEGRDHFATVWCARVQHSQHTWIRARTIHREAGGKAVGSEIQEALPGKSRGRYSILHRFHVTMAWSKPSTAYISAAKYLLHYLKGLLDLAITYNRDQSTINGHTHAVFAANPVKRKSTTGYLFLPHYLFMVPRVDATGLTVESTGRLEIDRSRIVLLKSAAKA